MTTTTQPDRNAHPLSVPLLFPRLTVAKTKRATKKTRAFSVQLAGYLIADSLWDAPTVNGPMAPAWMAYLASPAESAAFTANLRSTRIAEVTHGGKFRLPRRSGHRFEQHLIKHEGVEATLTVAYLPELFRLEPTTPLGPGDPVRFVFAPPHWWVRREAERLAEQFGDDAGEAAEAALFVACLDRRVHLPIVNDLAFHLALYRAAKDADWVTTPGEQHRFDLRNRAFGTGFSAVGIDTVRVADAPQCAVSDLIRDLTLNHREEIQHGTPRLETDCRLLQNTVRAATQLCLDFAAA